MRTNACGLCLSILVGVGLCSAQNAPAPAPASAPASALAQPDKSFVNCSGFVTNKRVPDAVRLISGEQSNYKITFAQGDYVYINRGLNQGVKVGDEFSVVRPVEEPLKVQWFTWQNRLLNAMGTLYEDEGIVRVVNVHAKVSIAQVVFSCAYMQRGDIIRPFEERPAPPFKEAAKFDHFAPVSGKPVAMVVAMTRFAQEGGTNSTVYVNLGSGQGVKVGDYFRIFRYQGSRAEYVPQTKHYQYEMYGFGSTPERYSWNDLPREILGEGIVLSVSRNSSTVLVTYSTIEIYTGDYVELE